MSSAMLLVICGELITVESIGVLMNGLNRSESTLVLLVLCFVAIVAFRAFIKWLCSGPKQPDPWDTEIANHLAEDACPPICHECLSPYDHRRHFCPECGATVGQYTSLMPPLYFHSMGHVFWTGTNGTVRRSPLIIGGFVIFGSAAYALLAPLFILVPFYWINFFQNLRASHPASSTEDQPPVSNPG